MWRKYGNYSFSLVLLVNNQNCYHTSMEWWLNGHRRDYRATPHSKSGVVAVRRYTSSKVTSSGCALLEQP